MFFWPSVEGKRPNRKQLIKLARTDPEAIVDLVLALWDRVEALEAKIAAMERNSRTSSKPPSSDKGNFSNPPKPKPKSLRSKSGRKPGGQEGHRGETLRKTDAPDAGSWLPPDSPKGLARPSSMVPECKPPRCIWAAIS